MRRILLPWLILALAGCGARSDLADPAPATGADASPSPGYDAGPPTRPDAGPPPPRDAGPPPRDAMPPPDATPPPGCALPTPRPCDLDLTVERTPLVSIVGERSVLEEVEVLSDGTVVGGGLFGLVRSTDGGSRWERVDAPLPLGSSFLHMRHRGTDLWAIAFGDVAYSPDAGDTWETLDTGRTFAAQLHFLPDGRLAIGGDNTLGLMEPPFGPTEWLEVEALNGDTGRYFENNTVFGLVESGGSLVAVERFGRVARAPFPEGPWEQVAIAGGDAELLAVERLGAILMRSPGGHVAVSCDRGESWGPVGMSPAYAAAASHSTQLALTDDEVLIAPGLDGIGLSCDLGQTWTVIDPSTDERLAAHDAAPAPDGSVWIGANAAFYHLRW